MHALVLALLSGIPALVYQVVWTREVVLLAGGQLDAIATVVGAFFGGLALGARWLGALSDRHPAPLRFYGFLEIIAAVLAIASFAALRALGDHGPTHSGSLLLLAAVSIAPVTFLLGGTQPALLRSVVLGARGASRPAGGIVGANTLGSVLGVGVAVAAIPQIGLRATFGAAAIGGLCVGFLALLLAWRGPRLSSQVGETDPVAADESVGPELEGRPADRARVLPLAALAGVATLGFEVLAARMAGLQLGSSLYAWGLVLGLFLLGLGAGNLAFARPSAASRHPAESLAWIEVATATWLALGLGAIYPPMGASAGNLGGLVAVAIGVLPAAFLMGGAFPYFARLAIEQEVGRSFGSVSAWNTGGGIVGALLVPALLLPQLGLIGAVHACAGLQLIVAGVLFARADPSRLPGRLATVFAVFAGAALLGGWQARQRPIPGVIFAEHGRNATAVVVASAGRRELIVDGDPEASTAGDARLTEELLAALPLSLHAAPRSFLEVGLGSGITLGTAGRFPLESLQCVEIAGTVIRAARFFEPDNRGVLRDPRLRLVRRDARSFLRSVGSRYDVVAANTLHPWSLGATGLYSRDYFARLQAVLAPGGFVSQWLPVRRIGPAAFGAIVRSFFEVFDDGAVFWGGQNVILIGSSQQISWPDAASIERRLARAGLGVEIQRVFDQRIASAAQVRASLAEHETLSDDRPRLEMLAVEGTSDTSDAEVLALLLDAARSPEGHTGHSNGMRFWLEGEVARAAGDLERAGARAELAEAMGLSLTRRSDALRLVEQARQLVLSSDATEARGYFEQALRRDPGCRDAQIGLALLELNQGDDSAGIERLSTWLDGQPADAFAWNQLAGALHRAGRTAESERAIQRALATNPFFPEALSTAGLIAIQQSDPARVETILERLEELDSSERSIALRNLAARHLAPRTH